jgi:hypothetical protein
MVVNLQSRLQCGDRRNKSKRTPRLPEQRGECGAIAPHRGNAKAIEEAATEELRSELDELPRTRPPWNHDLGPSDTKGFPQFVFFDILYK